MCGYELDISYSLVAENQKEDTSSFKQLDFLTIYPIGKDPANFCKILINLMIKGGCQILSSNLLLPNIEKLAIEKG